MSANGFGVVLGDIMASRFRDTGVFNPEVVRDTNLSGITGYTVLTAATAASLMGREDYRTTFDDFTDHYRSMVSGLNIEGQLSFSRFQDWAAAYVSPIAWTSDVFDKIILEARRYALALGCSPEATRGTECTAGVIFKARTGYSKEKIADYVAEIYGYEQDLKPKGVLHGSDCVQLATHAFLETEDVESALRLAVSLGKGNGAAASITGSIAEAYYQNIPDEFWSQCLHSLNKYLDEVLDVFAINHMYRRSTFEAVTGDKILPPEAPAEWKSWPMSTCVDFTFHQTFCITGGLHREYIRPTLSECAVKLFEGEDYDWIFPSYGITSDQIIPAFEWYVSWPLQRRGTKNGIIRRERACGAEGWEMAYERTLVRLYSLPTVYSNTSWCYIPSKGRLMLDVGGRTKQDAVNNWYKLAIPLRRILKEVRASRRQTPSPEKSSKRNGIAVKTEDRGVL